MLGHSILFPTIPKITTNCFTSSADPPADSQSYCSIEITHVLADTVMSTSPEPPSRPVSCDSSVGDTYDVTKSYRWYDKERCLYERVPGLFKEIVPKNWVLNYSLRYNSEVFIMYFLCAMFITAYAYICINIHYLCLMGLYYEIYSVLKT